ncbi:hypothetical protein BGX38DRAFT_1276305 [Terfezia claveryi]|nr:hypothetical protein BGX38DRAFT_1276786 [Terfezia claveryi]KAF8433122.1 hypothetical protein BGX38DRAFT_1276305 [Terfezia claveryi]
MTLITMDGASELETVLKTDLTRFLKSYGFLTYDDSTPGTRWYILMSHRTSEEKFRIFLNLIVQEWIEIGITRMAEWITLRGKKVWQLVIMVKEDVETQLAALSIAEWL